MNELTLTKRQELNKALHEIESIEKRLRAMADPMELGDGRFSKLMADYYVDHGGLPGRKSIWLGKRLWFAARRRANLWIERSTKGKRLAESIDGLSRTVAAQDGEIDRWQQANQQLKDDLDRLKAPQKQEDHTHQVLGFVHGLSPSFLKCDAPAVSVRQG